LSMQNGKLKEMAFNLLLFQVRVIITFWPRTEGEEVISGPPILPRL
jgi:hypothetical protein